MLLVKESEKDKRWFEAFARLDREVSVQSYKGPFTTFMPLLAVGLLVYG